MRTQIGDTRSKVKKPRGFAGMTLEKRTEAARKGGLAQPAHKRSFKRDPELAAAAGRKGGSAPHKSRGRQKVKEPTP